MLISFPEYGYGKYKDVIDGLQFERLASASGPTSGEIRRPSDGEVPKNIVFIACAGSRDPAKGIAYCSKICCMYTAKHAMLYKHKVHEGKAHVFYMDISQAVRITMSLSAGQLKKIMLIILGEGFNCL